MSTYEAPYKSLLQGVSQQLAQERLPGQLTAQVNMMSDPVTNLRRRPGVQQRRAWAWPGADTASVISWFTDLAGSRVHILVNTRSGNIRILNSKFEEEASLEGGAYLINAVSSRIRAAGVGNEFFLANLDKVPVVGAAVPAQNPANRGYFYVPGGAFGRVFQITAVYPGGGSQTVSYTTPSGAGTGDAALATPEYIASSLATALRNLNAQMYIEVSGPYVYVQLDTGVAITTTNGSQYMLTSGSATTTAVGNLPARLPAIANGFIMRVGNGTSAQYYRYNSNTAEWVEAGAYGSTSGLTNMPISVIYTGTAWALDFSAFEGRLAGDDVNNPAPEFTTSGITGMGTYQGRLVLLSGPLVSLSSSTKPRRFFRSTVTNVLASDPIEIGSSMNSAAAYEWAVPFQKDLILFSRAYQALIPSNNTAITPNNATVVPTSSHDGDTLSSPIAVGRTLMYCSPRSADFFGVLEMVPSQSTDSQYVSVDSTSHLPKYMPGRCRFAVSSGVASLVMFAPTGDTRTLIAHEYHWDADTKVQQAWHQWLFEYPVASAYFASDVAVLIFARNEQAVLCTLDPRAGLLTQSGERRPFLDMHVTAEIVQNVITIPDWMLRFDPAIASKLAVIASTGALAGEPVGFTASADGKTLQTVRSWPSGTVRLGLPYYSGIIPSPPVVTDYQQQVIHSGKATLLRYNLGTRNTSEFKVRVDDRSTRGDEYGSATLFFDSHELELGRGLFGEDSTSLVPCRTDLRSTAMEVWTNGTGELNVTSLEYVAKFNPKIKRR